jgi:hypothetical protein
MTMKRYLLDAKNLLGFAFLQYSQNLKKTCEPAEPASDEPETGERIPRKNTYDCEFTVVLKDEFLKTVELRAYAIKNRFFIPAGCAVVGLYLEFGTIIPVPVDLDMGRLRKLAIDGVGSAAYAEAKLDDDIPPLPWSNIPTLVAIVCNGGQVRRSDTSYKVASKSRRFLCLGTEWSHSFNSKTGAWTPAEKEAPSWSSCEPRFHFVRDNDNHESDTFKRKKFRSEEALSLKEVITVLLLNVGPGENQHNYLSPNYRQELDQELGRFSARDMTKMETEGKTYPIELLKQGVMAVDRAELDKLVADKNKEIDTAKTSIGGDDDDGDDDDDDDDGDDDDDDDDGGGKPKAKNLKDEKDRVSPLVNPIITDYEKGMRESETDEASKEVADQFKAKLHNVLRGSVEDMLRLAVIYELYVQEANPGKLGVKYFKQKGGVLGNYAKAVTLATKKGVKDLLNQDPVIQGLINDLVNEREEQKEKATTSKSKKSNKGKTTGKLKKLVHRCFKGVRLPRNKENKIGGTLVLDGTEEHDRLYPTPAPPPSNCPNGCWDW